MKDFTLSPHNLQSLINALQDELQSTPLLLVTTSDPATGKKRKHVIYFLASSPFTEVQLAKKGGLNDAKWFRLKDALDLNFYDDMLPVITKAVQQLTSKPSPAK